MTKLQRQVINKQPYLLTTPHIYVARMRLVDTFDPFKQFKNIYNTMNKGELIDAIAAGAKISKADAGRALEALTDSVAKTLKKGDKVTLVGFGTFSVTKRAARTGRNPQTGKAIQIKAKKVAKFKAGAELAKVVNK